MNIGMADVGSVMKNVRIRMAHVSIQRALDIGMMLDIERVLGIGKVIGIEMVVGKGMHVGPVMRQNRGRGSSPVDWCLAKMA